MSYNENGVSAQKCTRYFYMFSGASNSRSLQATYLKFAEYVDILVQIIYAKFKNDRTKNSGDTGCMKMEKNFFSSGNLF